MGGKEGNLHPPNVYGPLQFLMVVPIAFYAFAIICMGLYSIKLFCNSSVCLSALSRGPSFERCIIGL